MHAVRRELLELQAESVGLPLWTVPLPWPCSNEQYEARMRELCAPCGQRRRRGDGFRRSVSGRHPRLPREAARRNRPRAPVPGLANPDRRSGPDHDRFRSARQNHLRRSQGAAQPSSPAAISIPSSWPTCPPPSIPAAKTANSILLCMMAPASGSRSTSRSARSSSGMGSFLRISHSNST